MRPAAAPPAANAPISRFSSIVSDGNMLSVCGTYDIPIRISLSVAIPVMLASSKNISPCLGVSSPNTAFISVDLPQPLGPMMVTNSPGSTRTETPCRISVSP